MHYEIRVRGHLGREWSAWFGGLDITNVAHGEAVLAGPIPDQAALHGVLMRIRDLGLPLLAVNPIALGGSPDAGAGERPGRVGGDASSHMRGDSA
jgi:hypothetical protein